MCCGFNFYQRQYPSPTLVAPRAVTFKLDLGPKKPGWLINQLGIRVSHFAPIGSVRSRSRPAVPKSDRGRRFRVQHAIRVGSSCLIANGIVDPLGRPWQPMFVPNRSSQAPPRRDGRTLVAARIAGATAAAACGRKLAQSSRLAHSGCRCRCRPASSSSS